MTLPSAAELFSEWLIRRNWPMLRPVSPPPLLQQWVRRTDIEALPLKEIPAFQTPPTRLVVVMTYGRPAACSRLMGYLAAATAHSRQPGEHTVLLVFHDHCGKDYEACLREAHCVGDEVIWMDATRRLGKARFWETYQLAFWVAQKSGAERTVFLHDDVEFEANLFERAEFIWQATSNDPLRRVLYLFSSNEDEPNGRWNHFCRINHPDKNCRLTNWFDLQAFMVGREFFQLVDYRMIPVHPNRWRRDPTTSSGVGRQLTRRLRHRGSVYQAWPPLVGHGSEPSVANSEARQNNQLDNRAEYEQSLTTAREQPQISGDNG